LIIFGGMNNQNYIGSSLFIVNLDFNYNLFKENEEDELNELAKVGGKILHLKKNSDVQELILPPIK